MGRREEKKATRKQQIFAAALQLFQQQGFSATTIEQIAAAADIGKGTFFNYFPSKEAVIQHMNELMVTKLHSYIASTADFSERPAREQIVAIFRMLADNLKGQQELMRILATVTLLHQPALSTHQEVVRNNLDRVLSEIIGRAQQSGEIRSDRSADDIARLVGGVYFLSIVYWLDLPDTELIDLIISSLDLIFEGLYTKEA